MFDFNNENEVTCLIGDFNFDANGSNVLTQYLSSQGFSQIVKRATHLDGHILDHVYLTQSLSNLAKIQHHYVYYSDHVGIIVNIKKESHV